MGGGAGPGAGGKNGKNGKSQGGSADARNPTEYLLLIQQDDSDDHRADFLVDALDDATVASRDKDRAAAISAVREAQSRSLRDDDMPRP